MYKSILALALAAVAYGQGVGNNTAEVHPKLPWSTCTAPGACAAQDGEVVIDANWRWVHAGGAGGSNCYTGNTWDATLCPDDATCAKNCVVDGAQYQSTYGVTTADSAVTLDFVTQSQGKNIGSRLYLMSSETEYAEFKLLGNEFTFDVDVSGLPCGLNGAVYFVSMDSDGGMAKYPTNTAGAQYGTGYCDSQCPRDLKFINGQGNVDGWVPSTTNPNSGVGGHGSCCAEMDIWEANSVSAALTPHPCTNNVQHMCDGDSCGGTYSADRYAGDCDPDGCDFNSYRMGNTTFYGESMIVDTSKPFTVVTQFLTDSDGSLDEIKRFYVQGGGVIPNSESDISGVSGNSITTDFCTAQKQAFGDNDTFTAKGGLKQMGAALDTGMVLVLSLWDDYYSDMLWLDSTYPTNKTGPGGPRGSCATTSGNPSTVESADANAKVVYSNIKFGPINSTFSAS
jgi:cellulose 1,4-beta-cellobiosidase